MRDDAAAAARRIVEEVLARHGQGEEPADDTVAVPNPTNPATEEAAEGPSAPDRSEPVEAPVQGEHRDADTELLEAADDAASAASQIARRIVAEVLTAADEQHDAPAPAGDRDDAWPDASVRGVPAEGLSVEDEQTVGIEVVSKPTDVEDPPAREAAASTSPDTSQPTSAAEIVRRIVADVQAEAPPPSDEDGGSPAAEHGPEPDTTAVLEEQPAETATAALPQHHSVGVAARPETGSDPAPATAPAAPSRELEGWATPLSPGPSAATTSPDPAPRTLRWLLASLLGAVALAVLFPLAVAALRALVAMD